MKDTRKKEELREVYTFLLENKITTVEYRTFCYLLTRAKGRQKMKAEREMKKAYNSIPQSFCVHFAFHQECEPQNDDFLDL